MVRVLSSPYEEDYEDDNPPPWEYEEDGFISWVDEVFLEGYKDDEDDYPTLEEAIELLTLEGYEVEVD